MKGVYFTKGTCSTKIEYEINEDDTLKSLVVTNGCNGNLKGIAKLCEGKKVEDIINLLSGIKCGYKDTSCPDQIACALKEYLNQK